MFSKVASFTYSDFITTFKKFKVPKFQRAFDWKEKQINDLWEKIVQTELKENTFIGTIVCLDYVSESDKNLVLIDGQQRITTISLILWAIYKEIEKIKNNEISDISYIKNVDESLTDIKNLIFYKEKVLVGSPYIKRFIPGDQFKKVYSEILENFDHLFNEKYFKVSLNEFNDKEKIYIKNFNLIRKLVENYVIFYKNPREKIQQLVTLSNKTCESLIFVVIVCKSDTDAYDIFEGLNATALTLSPVDLVKNAILNSVKNSPIKNDVEKYWDELETLFYKNNHTIFSRFLRHQWISKNGYISNSGLFKAIKKEKLNKKNALVKSYVEDLKDDAYIYHAFFNDEYRSYFYKKKRKVSEDIIDCFINFRYLKIYQVYEVLLSYYNKYISDLNYSEKQLINDLTKLWNFCFRAKVLSTISSDYEKKFAEQAFLINKFSKKEMGRMSEHFFNSLKGLVNNIENDNLFIESFNSNIRYKENADNYLINLILNRIIDSNKDNSGITTKNPTIEHILPKDPEKWGLKIEHIVNFVHNIGNLTILAKEDNGSLSNDTLENKMVVFSNSAFGLNRNIEIYYKEYISNPELAIKHRGKDLAEIANKIFSL